MFRKIRAIFVPVLATLVVGYGVYSVSAPEQLTAATEDKAAVSSTGVGMSSSGMASTEPAGGDAEPGDANPAYSKVDIHSGVWNGGHAALWDLPIIDYYKIFGPEQRASGYRPEQPIKFSHVTHVQKNQMECQYCHWSVAKAAYAAIPEVQTCMGCHGSLAPGLPPKIAGSTPEKQAEIKKLGEYWASGKPVEWVKVHVMPDYVRFNHKRHVKAGVTCQECHGQVPKMEVVERVSSMKMGWCIDCHRQKGSSIDCYVCHH